MPIVVTGFTGSLMVIAVNAWMNHPGGFRLVATARRSTSTRRTRCSATATSGTSWSTCTWPATSSPASSSPGAYAVARLRGRWGRYERTALAVPLTIAALAAPVQVLVGDWAAREVAETQPIKLAALEGLGQDRRAARPMHVLGWYTRRRGQVRHRDPQAALAAGLPRPQRARRGPRRRPARPAPAGQRRPHLPSRRWSGSGRCWRCSARRALRARAPTSAARVALVLLRRWRLAGPLSVVALIAAGSMTEVGPPAVGRLPRDADLAGGHRRRRHPGRLRDAVDRLPRGRRRRGVDPAAAGARAAGRWRRTDAMSLHELPLVFVLARAGVLRRARRRRLRRRHVAVRRRPRRARRADPRARPRRDGPGVGGQPRLAHLRAHRDVDGLPGGLRLDRLDAVRGAVHRRARDHRPRRGLRAAQRDHGSARARAHRRRVGGLLGPDAVRARRRDRRDRLGPRARSATPRATSSRAG